MDIEIKVKAGANLFDMPIDFSFGKSVSLPNGIVIESRTISGNNFLNDQNIIVFVVTNVLSVGTGIVSNWLYDIIKDKVIALKINGKQTKIDKEVISNEVDSTNVSDEKH